MRFPQLEFKFILLGDLDEDDVLRIIRILALTLIKPTHRKKLHVCEIG